MRNPASVLLLAATAFCSAQAPTPAPAPSTTYHSDAMNLDFVYPSSFTGGKRADDPGARKAETGCLSVPVAVMDMRTGFNMIFLQRYDQSCLSKDVIAAAPGSSVLKFLSDSLAGFGKPVMGSIANYDLAGRSAATVSGSVNVSADLGKSIYGAASCVISDKNIVCFQFLSTGCQNLALLVASTVKFSGTPATPVIPAALAPACKP